jgi:cytochrome P450
MDPPRHTELRSFINATKVFSNRSMKAMEPAIAAVIDRLIDGFVEGGHADLVQDFAYQLPLQVGPVLIGFPEEDMPIIDSWHRPTQVRTPGVRGIPDEAFEGGAKIRAYIDDLVEDRRNNPKDDLVSTIAAASLDGHMTADEASGLTFILFEASIDTTSGLLSNAFYHLAKQPDQRQILIDDPSVIPNSVEEFLRFDDPVQFNARTLTRDFELHGQQAKTGDRAILLFGSANRDEREFPDPDRLDVTRQMRRHLGFGTGIHLCIGAPLARLESQLALERILTRIPDYELAGEPERIVKQNLRGFQHLPVSFSV